MNMNIKIIKYCLYILIIPYLNDKDKIIKKDSVI